MKKQPATSSESGFIAPYCALLIASPVHNPVNTPPMSHAADAELEPDDPYARSAQTFPALPQEMLDRLMAYGTEEVVAASDVLFRHGETEVDFFVVLDGAIEVFQEGPRGEEHVVHRHEARQFTGELDLFGSRQSLVSGRALPDTRVLRIRRADFRHMVEAEPDIGEIVMRAFILRRVGMLKHAEGGVVLIGPGHAGDTLRLERFLGRNAYPHRLLDTEADPDAGGFLQCFNLQPHELPVVIADGRALRNPANAELADALGLSERFAPSDVFDVAVVGAGPAGLAAAVYAASEGLRTVVLEQLAPGGQAGTSSRIENYLGFPTGISGQALAGRAQVQAQKFGARLAVSRAVRKLECAADPFRLDLDDGQTVAARTVVIATGARYRKLDLPNYARFEGQGIHYAATAMESALCRDEEVVVVGGGNSAGQAAMFLARASAHVHILVRGEGLAATMSDYLVQRILSSHQITLHPFTEVTALDGDAALQQVTWTDRTAGESQTLPIRNMFVMIGAEPNTEWLDGCLELDKGGFVRTGRDGAGQALPSPFATTRTGIYAVGDARAGSVKRVASAVGEGSVVVHAIHEYLSALP